MQRTNESPGSSKAPCGTEGDAPNELHHFLHDLARDDQALDLARSLVDLEDLRVPEDRADFGMIRVPGGERRLFGFIMVLSWSRAIWAHFSFEQTMSAVVRGQLVDLYDTDVVADAIRPTRVNPRPSRGAVVGQAAGPTFEPVSGHLD